MKTTANTILITGGAAGIGFALAQQLSERGNRVIVCGRNEEALAKAQSQVPALVPRQCDITDGESRAAMVEWLEAEHPELNVVINNAGVQYRRMLNESGALANIEQEVATNFTAPVQLIGALLPLLSRQPQSTIVNVVRAWLFAAGRYSRLLRNQGSHAFLHAQLAPPPEGHGNPGGRNGTADRGYRPGRKPTQRWHRRTADDDAEGFRHRSDRQLENGKDEVMVGLSAGSRKMGEALFERMNPA